MQDRKNQIDLILISYSQHILTFILVQCLAPFHCTVSALLQTNDFFVIFLPVKAYPLRLLGGIVSIANFSLVSGTGSVGTV